MSKKLLMNNVISGAVTPTFSEYNEFVIDINSSNITISLDTDRRGDTTTWDGNTDWGDGTVDTQSSHQYSQAGTYTVKTKYGLASPTSHSNNANIGAYLKQVKALNSNMTTMKTMFRDCSSLTLIDFSNFDTSKVTSMRNMFQNCTSLTSLDLSSFDTSNVNDMRGMFYNCNKLTSLDLSNWQMLSDCQHTNWLRNCSRLTLSNVTTTNANSILISAVSSGLS